MSEQISRRQFMGGALAATIVVGFDRQTRSWVTKDEVAYARPSKGFPEFDGVVVTDEASLNAAADDYGHIVHRKPMAVLKPKNSEDVAKMVKFAHQNGIKVAARGQGHSTQGQSQVDAGVVIDLTSMANIHEIEHDEIVVDAGIKWLDLLRTTFAQGLTPPALTDYISLSVGGVLSVGGLASQSPWKGGLVDNVLELEVVTGKGKIEECSPQKKSELFNAVRSGLGQFGIITRAKLRLTRAPRMTRLYHAFYDNLTTFLADLELLLDDQRFDTLQGFVFPSESGGWQYQLEANKYFDPAPQPNDGELLAGLSFVPGTQTAQNLPFFTGDLNNAGFTDRLEPLVQFLISIGVWGLPHPWINVFVPSTTAEPFISGALAQTNAENTGQGVISIYPYNRSVFNTPFFRVPETSHFFLFALLRNAIPPTAERSQELIALNRQLFEQVKAAGGMRYPVDSVPMTQQDWRDHFGPMWETFAMSKRFFDPENLLAPGQGIF